MNTTKQKIFIAKLIYSCLHLFLGEEKRLITRSGIHYEVDLREGIDLSVFLFGKFQSHITKNSLLAIPKNAIICDIGANFGIISLQLAKNAPRGHVYSFEPTDYALKKLVRNLSLNPSLSSRITVINSFVSSKNNLKNLKAFSSWRVDKQPSKTKQHPIHLGIIKPSSKKSVIALDSFCQKNKIKRLDFIKIDTDGHEPEVLKGAIKTLIKYHPKVIFEVGQYLMAEKKVNQTFYLDYFKKLNYRLYDGQSKKSLSAENFKEIIPKYGTTDIIALWRDRRDSNPRPLP